MTATTITINGREVDRHGWVVPLSNGARARCGGPGICSICREEERQLRERQAALRDSAGREGAGNGG